MKLTQADLERLSNGAIETTYLVKTEIGGVAVYWNCKLRQWQRDTTKASRYDGVAGSFRALALTAETGLTCNVVPSIG